MYKTLLTVALLTLYCLSAYSAIPTDTISVNRVFINTSSKAFDILSPATRLDMVDYAKENVPYEAMNEMYSTSRITRFSGQCIDVHISEVSSAQIFTLPTPDDGIAAIIYTVDAEGADSQIEFYSPLLKPLKTGKYFTPPTLTDFLSSLYKHDKKARNKLTDAVPFTALEYTFVPDTNMLAVSLALKDIISREDYDNIAPLLVTDTDTDTHTLYYQWDAYKSKFVNK